MEVGGSKDSTKIIQLIGQHEGNTIDWQPTRLLSNYIMLNALFRQRYLLRGCLSPSCNRHTKNTYHQFSFRALQLIVSETSRRSYGGSSKACASSYAKLAFYMANTPQQEDNTNAATAFAKRKGVKHKRWRADGLRFEQGYSSGRVKDCQTIKEAVDMTHGKLENLSARSLSAFWSSMPRLLRYKEEEEYDDNTQLQDQFDTLLARTMEDISTFGYRDLTQTTLGLARIVKHVGGSEKTYAENSPHQILQNLLIGSNNSEANKYFIFRHIAAASLPILPDFDSRHLSNFIYAYALAGYVPDFEDGSTLFDILAVEAIPNLRNYNSQYISNTLWAYATAKETNSTLFKEAGDTICARKKFVDDFRPQELANILWSYATANESHPELLRRVGDHISSHDNVKLFKPQELTSLVWAYATLDVRHPMLFEKIADHIVSLDKLDRFKPQSISNISWAYATLGETNSHLYKKLADHIVALESLNVFLPRGLSNIVRANAIQMKNMYIFADEWHPTLFKKVADHIIGLDNLESYNGQDCANILWSYATAKETNSKLFQKVADHILSLDNLDEFSSQAISNIVWACAASNEHQPLLFQKLIDGAFTRQNEFTPQGIVNFLWAYASSGEVDRLLFLSFVPTVQSIIGECNRQQLANIAWSYAVANVAAPSLFSDNYMHAILEKEDEFTVEALTQLHQWQLWQKELKSENRLPRSLREKCYEAFIMKIPQPSRLQMDVISNLETIGLHLEQEVLTRSGYRLDAIVEAYGNKIGVEVDGPSHFVGKKPTGSTILKRRQVANFDGIQVLSIPYFHWYKLGKNSGKKQQYLRTVLSLKCYKA